tara:strand:- start:6406 stop:6951 length:546 start_codon:yes stop_codon:yes gene_type:complete
MKIITIPDPILKKKCEPVNEINEDIKKLLDDMLKTMYGAGIGLAAPQIGVNKRLIVLDVSPRPGLKRYQEEKDKDKEEIKPNPFQMINPEITWVSKEKSTDEEGCLSIPGIMANVTRPNSCKVKYLDKNGNKKELLADGLLSRCLQHEIDHINGILFIDRLSKIKKNIILRKFKKLQKEKS